MWRWFRPPMFVLAFVLVGLLALLATLQYRWLGQISQADRERRRASLSTGASEFAQDIDRELTRAYLLFQMDPGTPEEMDQRVAARHDHWQATSRFPRLLKELYVFDNSKPDKPELRRFDGASRRLVPSEWPSSMSDWRQHLVEREVTEGDSTTQTLFVARMSQPVWETVPAIVAPMPMPLMLFSGRQVPEARFRALFSYAILTIDTEYLRRELLPTLADRHFRLGGERLEFQVAVVRTAPAGGVIYSSNPSFAPAPDAPADAMADLLQVRTQDFTSIAAEVRRFSAFTTTLHTAALAHSASTARSSEAGADTFTFRKARPLSIVVQQAGQPTGARSGGRTSASAMTRIATISTPRWKLLLKHPSGSLEAAVDRARRRNLLVSMSVLGVLGASMGLLVLSTRRAQRLARQQLEFVAAVSHELRTPLAVIRSAAENLADGVVRDDQQIRKYGDLMRSEGRRLTEMVEQILEFAGIQSGQRGFALRAVAVEPLLREIVSSSSALIEAAAMDVDFSIQQGLPAVMGDEQALRRAFQNLISNAVKYGASGGWIGLSAARSGSEVRVVVADRGMGIPPAEQVRVFEPFYRASEAVAAQIQGAGLGLSLVQRIVESHGGHVSLKSEPGQGSEFVVHLPAAGEEPVARHAGSAHPATATAGGHSETT